MLPFEGILAEGHPNGDSVYRRIPSAWVIPTSVEGQYRITSQAYQPRSESDGVSVVLGQVLVELGLPIQSLITSWPAHGLLALPTHALADDDLTVESDSEFGNEPGHALVRGNLSRKVSKRLIVASVWLKWPDLSS